MINIFLLEKSYSGQKAISYRRVMQVLLIIFKKTLDKQNDQVSPEIKVKVNHGRCL